MSRSSIAAEHARAARRKREAKPRNRKKSLGIPPLPVWNLAELPDDALLSSVEVAAWLRKATVTVASWRRDPNHPLQWERIPPTEDGVPRYRAGNLRRFINGTK